MPENVPADWESWMEYLREYASLQTQKFLYFAENDIYSWRYYKAGKIWHVAHAIEHLVVADMISRCEVWTPTDSFLAMTVEFKAYGNAFVGFSKNYFCQEMVESSLERVRADIVDLTSLRRSIETL